ncbi:Hint domain-containing protein [Pseudaestuariivita sp.]|uniref:Hint domain-containing protein n=1 Tax=Pseudaestuariivita sp. TaxID=2211669 RepID=UPI0040581A57
MGIGEAGSLTRAAFDDGEVIRVTFDVPIADPVIILTSTNSGGNEFALTVLSKDIFGFEFMLDEWEDEDGDHLAVETINWLAVDAGVHLLPDGRLLEAGHTTATDATSSVKLTAEFDAPPVVLTNVMSYNEADTVDSDPFNITKSGFDLALQEGAWSDGTHAPETVGYIAVAAGVQTDGHSGSAIHGGTLTTGDTTYDLGADFKDKVVLAETQSMNETDAGTVIIRGPESPSTISLSFDENSGAGSTAHADETVGIVAFEHGRIACFTPGTRIRTIRGPVEVTELVPGDLIWTQDGGHQPLRWIARTHLPEQRLEAAPELAPIRIRAHAFGPGLPARDMQVSPQHRMLLTGWKAQLYFGQAEVLAPAKALCNDHSITPAAPAPTDYLHLLFDRHHVIEAGGCLTESLHAGELAKTELDPAARHELFTLFPALRQYERSYGPTARPCLTVQETTRLL